MIYLDTETCGLVGPIITIQWSENSDIEIYDVWKHKIQDTLDLINYILTQTICGFNLSYDWFHICQMYTTMLLLDSRNHQILQNML